MAIPKIIHICWFGGAALDRNGLRCEASRNLLTQQGYEIKIWTEHNYDLGKSQSLKRAYNDAKWSLVSNYVRLDVLRDFGGVYIDTDIEVIKDFDDLLMADFFIGFMWDCTLGTAVIGAAPMNKIICDILESYDNNSYSLISPNNNTFTNYFLSSVDGFKLNGKDQMIGTTLILNKFGFEQPSLFRRSNYSVHYFSQSWIYSSRAKDIVKTYLVKILSLWLYRKYVCFKSKLISQYYLVYLIHTRGNALKRMLDSLHKNEKRTRSIA